MNRICIIGNSGSGKSTFANKLGRSLNRPIIHLDKEFWLVGWNKRFETIEEWTAHQESLMESNRWIIDGDYRENILTRLNRADTVIFFDIPAWKCILRVIKRTFNRKQPFDKVEGIKNQISFGFLRYINNYPYEEIRKTLSKYKNKKLYIVKNDKETEKLLEKLTQTT